MTGSGNDLNMSHPTLHKTLAHRQLLFLLLFFLRCRHGVDLSNSLVLGCGKRIVCPYFEFRVSTRYAPGTRRWSEGLAIAENRQICQDPGQDLKRPPTEAYDEKGKEKVIMMRMYPRTAQDAICYHIWWRRGTCSPRGKRCMYKYIRPAAVVSKKENKVHRSHVHELQSPFTIHTLIHVIRGGEGRY